MPTTPRPRNPPPFCPAQRPTKISRKVNWSSPLSKSRPTRQRVSRASPSTRNECSTFFKHLDAIREESPTRNRRTAPTSRRFRDIRDDTFEQDENGHADTDSDDSFFWEEEHTLLSNLIEDGFNPRDHDEEVLSLVESLQDVFDEEGVALKKEIAHAFVPTVNHVKEQFDLMEELVDAPYARGLVDFNTACKEIELHFLEEHDLLNEAYTAAKKRMDAMMMQLEEEYKHRDELWDQLEAAIDALVDPVLKELQETPLKVERTIAKLEKERKTLKVDNNMDAALAQQKFKELLSLMS